MRFSSYETYSSEPQQREANASVDGEKGTIHAKYKTHHASISDEFPDLDTR
jgi:hypothetical protein